ncbi:GNAT family N-acetyltransferase [Planococcus shenhongbingii]|uniref:GNAT family N-acetyltransferase n=1 Tax=Planococcus shenhongbingii TaxID=3058398 RepID=A0ABT8NGV7_9BACL|nr:GNAT family N-acetyltransferase [Planococcus sp. N017]MDN7246949.1 GNAT family N-acetyltransferase [Planococcus sp. N017]
MEKVYETPRTYLRTMAQDDLSAAVRFWGNSEVMEESGGATSLEALQRVLEGYKRCHLERGLSVYGIIEKKSGNMIGAAGFNISDSLNTAELLCHLEKDSWGKGYATEAVQACIELAKRHSGVEMIYASAAPGNERSLKLLQKTGFQFIDKRWFEDTQKEEPYFELSVK